MNIGRRGFFGLIAGFLAAPRANWKDLWRPADFISPPPAGAAVSFTRDPQQPLPLHSGVLKCVIGQYADYYSEHDGMIETGPGCFDRLADHIEELSGGDPRKIQMRSTA